MPLYDFSLFWVKGKYLTFICQIKKNTVPQLKFQIKYLLIPFVKGLLPYLKKKPHGKKPSKSSCHLSNEHHYIYTFWWVFWVKTLPCIHILGDFSGQNAAIYTHFWNLIFPEKTKEKKNKNLVYGRCLYSGFLYITSSF
jgi:hypothetical protein